ncbi:MAG: hypothetical protein KDD24_08875 [Flavobacteriales bacterium]|nr:hypothetical protein [Flavobacteriales bacterium]
MKKGLIYILLLLLAFSQLKAQETTTLPEEEYVLPFDSLKNKDKIRYQFSTGANMSYSKTFGSSASLFYCPSVNYLVSPRLTVGAGMTYVSSDVTNFRPIYDLRYQPFTGNISQYYTHITAKYRLTDRLTVAGSVFYNMAQFNSTAFGTNNKASEIDRIGYAAAFEYKVSDNVTLYGEIRVNDNNRNGFGFNSLTNQNFGSGGFMGQSSIFDTPFGGR